MSHLRPLLRVVLAIALHQPRALGAAVTDLGQAGPAGSSRALAPVADRARLDAALAKLVNDTSRGADGAALLGQMIAISRAHALRMPPSLVGLARALAILDGVVRTLDPAADPIADVRREMAWAAMREVWRRVLMMVAWIVATAGRGMRRAGALVAVREAPRLAARVGRESIAD